MLRSLFFLALSFSVSVAHACSSPDQLLPVREVSKQARAALLKGDFKALDQMVVGFQTGRTLTADGQPAIRAMYEGLGSPVVICGETVDDNQWIAQAEALTKWRAASPASHAAWLSLASFELASAWRARGTGWGNTLSEEQLAGMREHSEEARRLLYAMPHSARANERWYVVALEIALAQEMDPEHFNSLFDEAVKRFPNSYDIYRHKANYLSPKWYGSLEQQREFIEQSASQNSEISPYLYARLVWQSSDGNPFRAGLADWPRMRASVDALVKKYPTALWANRYANLACMAGDVPVLKAQLAQLGDGLNAQAWRGGANMVQICQAEAEGKKCFRREDTGATFCE